MIKLNGSGIADSKMMSIFSSAEPSMSKSEKEAQNPLPPPDAAPEGATETPGDGNSEGVANTSEITMRINLLGKLIVPPTTPTS